MPASGLGQDDQRLARLFQLRTCPKGTNKRIGDVDVGRCILLRAAGEYGNANGRVGRAPGRGERAPRVGAHVPETRHEADGAGGLLIDVSERASGLRRRERSLLAAGRPSHPRCLRRQAPTGRKAPPSFPRRGAVRHFRSGSEARGTANLERVEGDGRRADGDRACCDRQEHRIGQLPSVADQLRLVRAQF